MTEPLYVLRLGRSRRLEKVLEAALSGIPAAALSPELPALIPGSRLLFAAAVDEYGPSPEFFSFLRLLRQRENCLRGCTAGIVVDGAGELYTKDAAQSLALALSMAGCGLPGSPLVEGTGSLFNQHIQAKNLGLSLEETYISRIRELSRRVLAFTPPRFAHPDILMLHASDNLRSNTVWMGRETAKRLPPQCSVTELSLQNGTIYDCRGCSYEACLHFAENGRCFYGGTIATDILPAIRRCNALLFLCPNYNDAVSANLMALFNRLTNLLVRQDLSDKYLFGIVVSGYSGSDLVARQLLGAMSLNKTVMLPPRFCLLQTAHEPGTASRAEGIDGRLDAFAAGIARTLLA